MTGLLLPPHPTHWRHRHRNVDGEIIWASGVGELDKPILPGSAEWIELDHDQPWSPNSAADELEDDILDVYFRGSTAPTNFYLALYNDTPVDTDTMALLTGEPSGNGYARQLIERSATGFPTLALDGGDYMLTSSTETFTASGGSIGPVTYACLVTVSTGTAGLLLIYNALSQSRTLADGESLDCSLTIKAA